MLDKLGPVVFHVDGQSQCVLTHIFEAEAGLRPCPSVNNEDERLAVEPHLQIGI